MTTSKTCLALLVCALTACGAGGGSGDDGGGSSGICSGATAFSQTTTANTTLDTAQVVQTAGKSVTLFGKNDAALSGWFKFTGFTAGQTVKVEFVKAGCAHTGCAGTFDFSLSDANGDELFSAGDGTCGSATVQADGAGTVHATPAAGGSGGEGQGLLVTPQ